MNKGVYGFRFRLKGVLGAFGFRAFGFRVRVGLDGWVQGFGFGFGASGVSGFRISESSQSQESENTPTATEEWKERTPLHEFGPKR